MIRTGTGYRQPGSKPEDNLLLDPSEMWSAKRFGVDKVFRPLNLNESHEIKVENFFNLRSWEEYTNFLSASRNMVIKRPTKSILLGSRANAVSKDYLDSDEGQT